LTLEIDNFGSLSHDVVIKTRQIGVYQRVALIENLLDVDLADGATVTALHAALFGLRRDDPSS